MVEFFNLTPTAGQDFFDKIFERTLVYLLVSPAQIVMIIIIVIDNFI